MLLALHHHTDGSGRCVPNIDPVFLQIVIPAGGIKVGFIHQVGDPVHQRCYDPVRGAGYPSRVGRAPEHIPFMEIQHILAGHVVHQNRIVHVNSPFRHSGGSAREVQQADILRIGWYNIEVFRCFSHCFG